MLTNSQKITSLENKTFLSFFNDVKNNLSSGFCLQNNTDDEILSSVLPSSKNEHWQFSSVYEYLNKEYNNFSFDKEYKLSNENKQYIYNYLKDYKNHCNLIFVNGVLKQNLSSQFDFNYLKINSIKEFLKDENVLNYYLNDLSYFSALNYSRIQNGVYIEVKKDWPENKKLHIVNFIFNNNNLYSQNLNIIKINSKNNLNIIESNIVQNNKGDCLLNFLNHLVLDTNSQIDYSRVNISDQKVCFINKLIVDEKQKSNFNYYANSTNADYIRNEVLINNKFSYSKYNLSGVEILKSDEVVDNNIIIKHDSDKVNSNQSFKYILKDNSKGIFNGFIHVSKGTRDCEAKQKCQAIELSETSKMKIKPQMKIFTENVMCNHGTTVGQIDKEALFYLQARGLSKDLAYQMLLEAFLNSILDKINDNVFTKHVFNVLNNN